MSSASRCDGRKLRRECLLPHSLGYQQKQSSLEDARLRDDGYAVWEEEDYCSPPLAQERAAALDEFFDDLEVTVVERGEGWAEIEELPRLFPQLPSH